MHFPEKKLTLFFYAYFLALTIWSLALFITHQQTNDWNYLFNVGYAVIYLSGGLIAFFGVKKSGLKNTLGLELGAIGTGITCYGIGLLVWAYYNLALRIETPFPSLADAFFVLYAPFLGYGIFNLLRVFGIMISKKIYAEATGIFLLAALAIFAIGNPPDLSPSLPLLTKALNIYYLLGDSFLITLGLMLIRLTYGRINGSFFYFFVGLLSMATADFAFSYRTANGIYWNGDISDILFTLAGLMFTLGIIKIVATQSRISDSFPS